MQHRPSFFPRCSTPCSCRSSSSLSWWPESLGSCFATRSAFKTRFNSLLCTKREGLMSVVFAACVAMTLVRLQIKGTFYRSYTDAVLNYNAQDEVSGAVDNMQRRVSHCCCFFNASFGKQTPGDVRSLKIKIQVCDKKENASQR